MSLIQSIKPNYLVKPPPTQHHNFFRTLPLYAMLCVIKFTICFCFCESIKIDPSSVVERRKKARCCNTRVCRAWNELPLSIKEFNTLPVFRKKLFNNFMISSVPLFYCKTLFNYVYDKFSAYLLSSLSYFYNEVRVFLTLIF